MKLGETWNLPPTRCIITVLRLGISNDEVGSFRFLAKATSTKKNAELSARHFLCLLNRRLLSGQFFNRTAHLNHDFTQMLWVNHVFFADSKLVRHDGIEQLPMVDQ